MGKNNTGFAIALAWPRTYCKQSGAWYDPIMNFLKISDNNYYRVGHAALVLIDKETKKCHYYDFGRYQAPFAHGRVRSGVTDHELELQTVAKFSGDILYNLKEILTELQSKEVYHGEGDIHGSYTNINFEKANKKALQLQNDSPIIYGPFIRKGSNCSRFVSSVILAGKPKFWHAFKMRYFVPFTPTPISNIKALEEYLIVSKPVQLTPFVPPKQTDKTLNSTVDVPEKHSDVPETAQWLSGEGYGSWYHLQKVDDILKMSRYSPYGKLECSGFFNTPSNFNIDDNYTITYLSHCAKITLIIKDEIVVLERLSDDDVLEKKQKKVV